jgi:hypothetical protein
MSGKMVDGFRLIENGNDSEARWRNCAFNENGKEL